MIENELSRKIIGLGIQVHSTLGPGLLENVYKECLYHLIKKSGLHVEKEVCIPIHFEGINLDCGYRIDLLVEKKLLIELKSVESIKDIHIAQTLTYLKLGHYKLGLLLNFNETTLKSGIRRIINNYIDY